MRISMKRIKGVFGFLGALFLLLPMSVFAQNKVVVIPLFGGADSKPLKNIITVAKANGMFTDPVAAVNSITDASETNPYLVVIGPGVYTVTAPVVMKQWVDIAGSGENVTKIKGAISGGTYSASAIIRGANYSALSFLTVENKGGGTFSIAMYNGSASPRLSHVIATASGGTSNYGVLNDFSSPVMTNVTVTATGGTYSYGVHNISSSSSVMTNVTATASGVLYSYGIRNDSSSPVMTNVTATATTAAGGTFSNGVVNSSSSPVMTNVTATATGGTESHGVYNYNSPSSPTMTLKMMNVTATASGVTYSLGVYNYNSPPSSAMTLEMTNVTATASGGTNSYGVYNMYSTSPWIIRRSTLSGGTGGLYANSGTARVSQSTIQNGAVVDGGGTNTCVACDNGSGVALGVNCN